MKEGATVTKKQLVIVFNQLLVPQNRWRLLYIWFCFFKYFFDSCLWLFWFFFLRIAKHLLNCSLDVHPYFSLASNFFFNPILSSNQMSLFSREFDAYAYINWPLSFNFFFFSFTYRSVFLEHLAYCFLAKIISSVVQAYFCLPLRLSKADRLRSRLSAPLLVMSKGWTENIYVTVYYS